MICIIKSTSPQKQAITSQMCSLDSVYTLHIPCMPVCFVHLLSFSLKMAQNGSQYVSNTGSFCMCLLVSTQGLESIAWRTCETPALVAELVESEGDGTKRARAAFQTATWRWAIIWGNSRGRIRKKLVKSSTILWGIFFASLTNKIFNFCVV